MPVYSKIEGAVRDEHVGRSLMTLCILGSTCSSHRAEVVYFFAVYGCDGAPRAHGTTKRGRSHTFFGFLDDCEDVLAHMRAAKVFASPSTREGFGITLVEAMAADCTVVAVAHPDSAASEVVGEAGFLTEPSVEGITDVLERALAGKRPPTNQVERAATYDWDGITTTTEQYLQKLS